MVGRTAVTIMFLVLAVPSLAVSVNPASHQLTNPQDQVYQFVYSIINDDPQPRALNIKLEPFSKYLEDQISFSKQQFTLLPGEAENLQLSIQPRNLGPETHSFKAGVYDGDQKVAAIELLITVPGTPVENYAVSMTAGDTTTEAAVPVNVELSNYGNIIGYSQLLLEIEQGSGVIGAVRYPEFIQVLPGATVSYDLVYTEALKPGFYTAKLTVIYPTTNVSATDQFSVRLEETKESIAEGSDLILTFASLGNPPAVTYTLTDNDGRERAAGTFLPQTGDIVVPTSTLVPGKYTLTLKLQNADQRIQISIKPHRAYGKVAVIVAVIIILGYALYSNKQTIMLQIRVYRLQKAVKKRQDIVINLINRSHRMVDNLYARRNQASGDARAPAQRP